jgi:predicted acyl esterase
MRRVMQWVLLAALPALILAGCGDDTTGGGRDGSVDAQVGDGAATDGGTGDDGGGADCADHALEDMMIPMSDGQLLAAFLRRPVNGACRLPTILIQTPYNKEGIRAGRFTAPAPGPLFDSPAYAFVVLDWRGFFGSAAAAVAQPDYGQDGHDAVAWIAQQDWSDGQVGTWGVSALGRVQLWTATRRPPALKAIVPIFSPLNTEYEAYYPGGVLRREYVDTLGLLYGASMVEQHPFQDAVWLWFGDLYDAADMDVPVLLVAGWYDLDNARSFDTWDDLLGVGGALSTEHCMVVGAWHHFATSAEAAGAGRPLTAQELLYHDGEHRIQTDSLAWFDAHLRGLTGPVDAWERVRYERDGEGLWEGVDTWPPANTTGQVALYLDGLGELSDVAPPPGELSYVFDPDDPAPSIGGQTLHFELLHGPHDQQDVIARSDVLVFESEPLTADLRVRGGLEAVLAVSTTGVDTDLVVLVTDVDESGSHLLLADGVRRLSLRDSLTAPTAVTAGQRYELTVKVINQLAYTFAAGHRVGLIVSSGSYPRFARNPGNGATFYTDPASSIAVTNTVFTDGVSRLILPID